MLIKPLFQEFIVYVMNNLCAKFGSHISSNGRDKQGGGIPPQALSFSNHRGQKGLTRPKRLLFSNKRKRVKIGQNTFTLNQGDTPLYSTAMTSIRSVEQQHSNSLFFRIPILLAFFSAKSANSSVFRFPFFW